VFLPSAEERCDHKDGRPGERPEHGPKTRFHMLPCPHCNATINLPATTGWSLCPRCEQPIRRELKKDGSVSLTPGQEKKNPVQVKPMRLREIRGYNARIDAKLTTLRTEKEKISKQISQSVTRNRSTQPLREQLADLEHQTDQLKDVSAQLLEMESLLLIERKDAVDQSSPAGGVFGCSLALIALNVILFAWLAAAIWNWKLILIEIVVIAATSVVLFGVASPRHRDDG
jgi:hypothetical protein